MSARYLVLAFVTAHFLAGCAAPNVDLVPLPATEGVVTVSDQDVATLQVRVQNQGIMPSQSSPVAVAFLLHNITVTSAIQDGGGLQPDESSPVLTFPIPKDCLEGGCAFQVLVDPENRVESENRSNNMAIGHCEGRVASRYTPTSGLSRPQVQ